MQDAVQIIGTVVQIGLLAGIFTKIGRFGAVLDFHETRLDNLEGKKTWIKSKHA